MIGRSNVSGGGKFEVGNATLVNVIPTEFIPKYNFIFKTEAYNKACSFQAAPTSNYPDGIIGLAKWKNDLYVGVCWYNNTSSWPYIRNLIIYIYQLSNGSLIQLGTGLVIADAMYPSCHFEAVNEDIFYFSDTSDSGTHQPSLIVKCNSADNSITLLTAPVLDSKEFRSVIYTNNTYVFIYTSTEQEYISGDYRFVLYTNLYIGNITSDGTCSVNESTQTKLRGGYYTYNLRFSRYCVSSTASGYIFVASEYAYQSYSRTYSSVETGIFYVNSIVPEIISIRAYESNTDLHLHSLGALDNQHFILGSPGGSNKMLQKIFTCTPTGTSVIERRSTYMSGSYNKGPYIMYRGNVAVFPYNNYVAALSFAYTDGILTEETTPVVLDSINQTSDCQLILCDELQHCLGYINEDVYRESRIYNWNTLGLSGATCIGISNEDIQEGTEGKAWCY